MLALAASTLTAHAQSPADTLQDVRPFSTHALDLLMAREPGVEVISSPGAPGMTPTIHVRGIAIAPGVNPVYVVDGMRRRNLDGIAPESIEKIEVLKDAAAMSVWGPEAAAGVVVVTTRRASQQGFHAGYEFAGGFQSLAYTPERITMAEWRKLAQFQNEDLKESIQPDPETTFLQKHHIYAQYGGNKLSAHAGFSVLDNDGPYSGKEDTHRRYAASWSAEYRPLHWLSLETMGRWNRSSTSRAQGWLEDYLLSIPTYNQENWFSLYSDRDNLSETVIQGRVNAYPLPGLYVRGNVGYSRGMKNLCKVEWEGYGYEKDPDLVREVEATAGHAGKKWFQWGIETGWNKQWGDHRIHLDGTFRRIKEKQDNQVLWGTGDLSDIGLKYGDDDLILEKLLLPYYEEYQGGGLAYALGNFFYFPALVGTPELKWKEGILSTGYDWKGRYEVAISYFRAWEEKLFSDEGWGVPSMTLGWTLTQEPLLRQVLPESLIDWSVKASWSASNNYVHILDNIQQYVFGQDFARALTASRHRDLTTSLSFQFEGPTLDLSASWYVNDDDMHMIASTLRNQGIELSGALRGNVGPFHYAVSSWLTLYKNRVTKFNRSLLFAPWQNGSPLSLKEGESIGGYYVKTYKDGVWSSSEDEEWRGGVFPTTTGGFHVSAGWNGWQITVSGHGDKGQNICHYDFYDALSRHYMENMQTEDNPNGKYPVNDIMYFVWTEYSVFPSSFFRIDQIRMDYTLPLRNVRLNLFASLENWFLFTKYPGTDPELPLAWNDWFQTKWRTGSLSTFVSPPRRFSEMGVETANIPSTRRVIFGLQIGF